MKSITGVVEGVLQNVTSRQIPILVNLFGYDSTVYRRKSADGYSDAYGVYSQDSSSESDLFETHETRILANLHGFTPSGHISSLNIFGSNEDIAYAKGDIKVGDVVKIKREDGRTYSIVIKAAERIGVTLDILWRLKWSSYED